VSLPSPASTPPAHVAQLERRIDHELKAIRDKIHANHLATTHQIGQLSQLVQDLIAELRRRPA
jgi:hypothetical protein